MNTLKSILIRVKKLSVLLFKVKALNILNIKLIFLIFSFCITQSSFADIIYGYTVPGEFSAAGGTARYTVPITVPPGMAGMQPSINLNYSSQSGYGVMGKGWSIGGLSVIARCAQSKVVNGQIRGVDFTYDDVFCLDGVQLIPISGTNGTNLSEYRTQIDSFHKIILHDADGKNGPDFFEVFTK